MVGAKYGVEWIKWPAVKNYFNIFIDVLLNFLRVSKLSDVEGFLKLRLFLEFTKCATLDILNLFSSHEIYITRVKATNMIFNGSARVM